MSENIPTDLQIALYSNRLVERVRRSEARQTLEKMMDKFGGMEVLDGLKAIEECFDADADL
jgi:hypothetical protein